VLCWGKESQRDFAIILDSETFKRVTEVVRHSDRLNVTHGGHCCVHCSDWVDSKAIDVSTPLCSAERPLAFNETKRICP